MAVPGQSQVAEGAYIRQPHHGQDQRQDEAEQHGQHGKRDRADQALLKQLNVGKRFFETGGSKHGRFLLFLCRF